LRRSPQEALGLLESAADAGYWRSSVTLGILARDGNGVPKDDKAAYYHFQVAILQGGATVRDLLRDETRKLAGVLDDEQLGALDSEASLWFQDHHLTLAFVNRNGYKGKNLSLPSHSDPTDVLNAGAPAFNSAS
jgi:hypothetical protein